MTEIEKLLAEIKALKANSAKWIASYGLLNGTCVATKAQSLTSYKKQVGTKPPNTYNAPTDDNVLDGLHKVNQATKSSVENAVVVQKVLLELVFDVKSAKVQSVLDFIAKTNG